jgi:hypothetical protein
MEKKKLDYQLLAVYFTVFGTLYLAYGADLLVGCFVALGAAAVCSDLYREVP